MRTHSTDKQTNRQTVYLAVKQYYTLENIKKKKEDKQTSAENIKQPGCFTFSAFVCLSFYYLRTSRERAKRANRLVKSSLFIMADVYRIDHCIAGCYKSAFYAWLACVAANTSIAVVTALHVLGDTTAYSKTIQARTVYSLSSALQQPSHKGTG